MAASRTVVVLFGLIALSFAGCNPAAKAIGQWEVEVDKFKAQLPATGDNAAASVLAGMSLFLKIQADVEIKADNTWRNEIGVAGNTQSTSGTWKYAKTEGDTLVLSFKASGGDAERELKLKFLDDDHVEASGLMGNQVLPLKRKTKT
jgi:hypothetical protein